MPESELAPASLRLWWASKSRLVLFVVVHGVEPKILLAVEAVPLMGMVVRPCCQEPRR